MRWIRAVKFTFLRKRKEWGIFLLAMICLCRTIPVCAEDLKEPGSGQPQPEEWADSWLEELDVQEIENALEEILPENSFHFREAVMELFRGEIPVSRESLTALVKDTLFAELRLQKDLLIHILILVIAAAVFSSFIKVFRKNQISDIAFYMIYLMLFMLVMNGFRELSLTAEETMGQILHFMRLLLPVYLAAAFLASGSVTALGYYELTLFFITAVQTVMLKVVLPGIGFYVLFQLLNHLGREDYLSRMAELIKGILSWLMKTMLALVIGIQTVQGLLLPAIDSLKNSLWKKAAEAVPVLGNTFSSVTETVLGTAVILKNAVGAAGLLVIGLICLVPVVRLAVCTLFYQAVGAAVQPVSDKRITECISRAGEGIGLLLKAVAVTGMMFLITLAMVTASVRS